MPRMAQGELTIVTSFPKDLTNDYKQAFDAKNPGLQLELINKKTTAGIKYLQETSGSNTSDLYLGIRAGVERR
ncbi:MAG: hypothetical protein ABW168_26230 [Sedimenticola sp.]